MDFMTACVQRGVPVCCHIFAEGGHGYGLDGPGDSEGWGDHLMEWLQSRGWTETKQQPSASSHEHSEQVGVACSATDDNLDVD